jgi:hypothetical protein
MIRRAHTRLRQTESVTGCVEVFNEDTGAYELVAGSDPSCGTGSGEQDYTGGAGSSLVNPLTPFAAQAAASLPPAAVAGSSNTPASGVCGFLGLNCLGTPSPFTPNHAMLIALLVIAGAAIVLSGPQPTGRRRR